MLVLLMHHHTASFILDPHENEMPLVLEQKDRVNYEKLFTSKVIGFEELELGEFLGQG